MKYSISILILLLCSGTMFAQEKKANVALIDGVIIGGYADNGAFLNFTGPNVNFTSGESKFIIGHFPLFVSKKIKAQLKTPLSCLC